MTTDEGEEKAYTISIDTTYINNLSEADTSSWSFMLGCKKVCRKNESLR